MLNTPNQRKIHFPVRGKNSLRQEVDGLLCNSARKRLMWWEARSTFSTEWPFYEFAIKYLEGTQ